MIFGVSPTKDTVVIAQAAGSGETFAIKSITSIPFQARSGADLGTLLKRLVVIFDRGGKARRSTIALLGSSSGRFKSSVEAIKAKITNWLRPEQRIAVVRVTAAVLKRSSVVRGAQKWQARAAGRFNPDGPPRELRRRAGRRHGPRPLRSLSTPKKIHAIYQIFQCPMQKARESCALTNVCRIRTVSFEHGLTWSRAFVSNDAIHGG